MLSLFVIASIATSVAGSDAQPRPPIHIVWLAESGAHFPCNVSRVGIEFTAAVHIGKGYLVASSRVFRNYTYEADGLSRDPVVCLVDGDRIVEGHLVDSARSRAMDDLVLIKTQISGPSAVPNAKSGSPRLLVAYDVERVLLPPTPIRADLIPCASRHREDLEGTDRLCAFSRFDGHAVGIAYDMYGSFAGMMTLRLGLDGFTGPSAKKLLAFVDSYFGSWGKLVPKDQRPW